jgi:hypothetical protein
MKVHSVVDIITNSSSEIFVVHTDEEPEEVLKKAYQIWEKYGKIDAFSFKATRLRYGDAKYMMYPKEYESIFPGGWVEKYRGEIGEVELSEGLNYSWEVPDEMFNELEKIYGIGSVRNYQEG